MRVALLGGVFGDPMEDFAWSAPESVLRRFLAADGHEVVALSAHRPVPDGLAADVFHANHFGLATWHLALAGVRPLVVTPHDPFLASDYATSESRLEHALQGLALRRADAVVALSSREAGRLAARFALPPEKVAVIPNGLDLERYEPGKEPAPEGPLEILTAGQLVEYKGHRYLLEALATLRRDGLDARLVFVSHQPALRSDYERLARDLGVGEAIAFEGPLSTPELAARLGRCDVYAQPSLAEAFSVTILEAMACGRPIVATDVGGTAEMLGETGIVVPPRDAPALAGALRRLAADPEERRRLGERASARVRGLYDARTVARRHAELYSGLAGRGAARPPRGGRDTAARALLALYERKNAVARLAPERLRRRRVA